jgi:ceramide glucosyltransferase
VYAVVAIAAVRRFARDHAAVATAFPGVSVLKPLHGAEAALYDNLASFCDQDYDGPMQLLFGTHDANDPAIAVAERLAAERPDDDIRVLVTERSRGPNPKIANLIGMQDHIRHDIVMLADSDIVVERNYLSQTVAALNRPGVGLVTCLYRGEPRRGLWGRLSGMAVDYHFLPSVLVGLTLGVARPCFGSTIALRRETLAAIGGFGAFLDQLADDNAMGEAVRARGMQVAIPPFLVMHTCQEQSPAELWRHELRWARTIRAISPRGYAGLVITHPLPFAILGAWASGSWVFGASIIAAAVGCRLVLQTQVDHTLHVNPNRWWLGPARDLLAFAVYVASYFVDVVSWRGRRYKVRPDGTLIPIGDAER